MKGRLGLVLYIFASENFHLREVFFSFQTLFWSYGDTVPEGIGGEGVFSTY